MAAPSPTLNPIDNSNLWMYFTLRGIPSPGTIPINGIKGFKRETGWDKKAGKGTQGATLTLKTLPPVEGTITLQLITPTDFNNWDIFVSKVLAIAPAKQKASGLAIYHPQFASIGLVSVVVADYTGPEYQGKGKYYATIKLIEWQAPPPVSIVATVGQTFPDLPDSDVSPPNPEIAALQAQIATLQHANQP
jgi:hypothetical protein